MRKKFLSLLSAKCKDMGLTAKALEELSEIGSKGLAEDASDEDVSAKVDLIVPVAKAMQGEITRKTSKKPQSKKPQSDDEGDDDEGGEADVPSWFTSKMKAYDDKLAALQSENETLKSERTKTDRQNTISQKAKELGIPDYLMKRVSFADDSDIDKELADYKQDLVNNNLMQKDAASEAGKTDEALKADAKAWAESLPNM